MVFLPASTHLGLMGFSPFLCPCDTTARSSGVPKQPWSKSGFCKSIWRLYSTPTSMNAAKARQQPMCWKDRFLSLSGELTDWWLCLSRETDCLECEIANYHLGRLLEGEVGREGETDKQKDKDGQTDRNERWAEGKRKGVTEMCRWKTVALDKFSCQLWHHLCTLSCQ